MVNSAVDFVVSLVRRSLVFSAVDSVVSSPMGSVMGSVVGSMVVSVVSVVTVFEAKHRSKNKRICVE